MATVQAFPGSATTLGTAQTGNTDTTNTAQRTHNGPGAVVVTSTVGATPTVTVNIQGSVDGTNFYNVPYSVTQAYL